MSDTNKFTPGTPVIGETFQGGRTIHGIYLHGSERAHYVAHSEPDHAHLVKDLVNVRIDPDRACELIKALRVDVSQYVVDKP